MRTKFLMTVLAVFAMVNVASADHIWVNELHYDNTGGDLNEFIEVGIRTPNGSGAMASDYVVEFYNGSNGTLYDTTTTLDQFGTINAFPVVGTTDTITLYASLFPGIQNGAPDGFAIVNQTTGVLVPGSFYSYEGSFAATDGAAVGVTSLQLSASEGTQDETFSLSAIGTGVGQDQFNNTSFVEQSATFGTINGVGTQVFAPPVAIPEPSALAFLGLVGCAGFVRRRR